LFLRRKDLDDPLQLRLPADERIEDVPHGHLGQVAGELVEERGLFLLLGQGLALGDGKGVLADGVEAHPPLRQQPAGSGVLDPQQTQ